MDGKQLIQHLTDEARAKMVGDKTFVHLSDILYELEILNENRLINIINTATK